MSNIKICLFVKYIFISAPFICKLFMISFWLFCQDYPFQNAHCLVLVKTCADEDEAKFVTEYIKENDIHIKLGILYLYIL